MKTDAVRRLLRAECKRLGSKSEFARKAGVTKQLVHAVLNGNREPRGRILDALDLEVEIIYRPKSSSTKSLDTGFKK